MFSTCFLFLRILSGYFIQILFPSPSVPNFYSQKPFLSLLFRDQNSDLSLHHSTSACLENIHQLMATSPVNTPKKNSTRFPPKRGKIKAQIYESIIETVTSAALKAGESMGMIKRGGDDGGGGGGGGGRGYSGGSGSTSPPDSAYPSDGYADHA